MRPVNLYPDARAELWEPEAARQARALRAVGALGAVLLLAVVGALVFAFVVARNDVADKQRTLAGLNRQLALVQKQQAVAPPAAVTDVEARFAAVSAAASSRVAWDAVFSDLSYVMPDGTWLTSLTAQTPQAARAATSAASSSSGTAIGSIPTAFVVSGYAPSQDAVAQVLERLALIPALSDVALQETQRSEIAGKTLTRFTIGADVNTSGATGR